MLDENIIDANGVVEQANNFARQGFDGNNVLDSFLQFVLAQFNSAWVLIQQNYVWALVIIGLSWLLSDFGLKYVPFLKKGLIRYFIAFLIVMAISGIWVSLFQGIVSGA